MSHLDVVVEQFGEINVEKDSSVVAVGYPLEWRVPDALYMWEDGLSAQVQCLLSMY